MAPGKSCFGTNPGKIESQAGRLIAHAALSRNVVKSSIMGEARSKDTTAAKIEIRTAVAQETATMSFRGLKMSAIAPAGRVKRNIGRFVAACTSETSSGLRSSVVISQPDAVSYMAMPIIAVVLASQRVAKAGYANAPSQGLPADACSGEGASMRSGLNVSSSAVASETLGRNGRRGAGARSSPRRTPIPAGGYVRTRLRR